MIGGFLAERGVAEVRVLSLCAGDAGDLADGVRMAGARSRVTGAAVELDAVLAARAQANLHASGCRVEVAAADAGQTQHFVDRLPVDLLLLVGVFGNISNADIARTIRAIPSMCAPGAAIVWTRHRRPPDLTPWIRQRLDEVGCEAVEFVSPGEGQFAIGLERLARPPRAVDLPERLFRFVD